MKDFLKRSMLQYVNWTIGVCSVLLGTTILATNAVWGEREEAFATAAEATTISTAK